MKEHDLVSSLIWLLVGALFGWQSFDLGVGTLTEPGAGFYPLVIASFLVVLSAGLFVASVSRAGALSFERARALWPDKDGFRRIGLTVLLLSAYVACVTDLGFAITTFLFVFFLLLLVEPQTWRTVVFGSLLTAAAFYLIFEVWLRANLPAGLLAS